MLPCQTPFKDVLIGVDPWLVLVLVHLAVSTSQPHLARARRYVDKPAVLCMYVPTYLDTLPPAFRARPAP